MKRYLSIVLFILILVIGVAGSAAGEDIIGSAGTAIGGDIIGAEGTAARGDTDMKAEETWVKFGIAIFNFMVGRDLRAIESMDGLQDLLKNIAEAGYDGVEWFNDILNDSYIDLPRLKGIMDELGLETSSLHFAFQSFDTLEEDARIAIERCQILGTENLIIAMTSPRTFGMKEDAEGKWTTEQIDAWAEYADQVITIMQNAASGTGIKILYHNHNQEFLTCSDGTYFLDRIEPDGKQIDVYWAAKGLGGNLSDAIDYIKTNLEDVYLLHIKDGKDGSEERNDISSWGAGDYDIQSILDIARKTEHLEWVIAENDMPAGSGLEDARTTAKYAAENLDFSR